MPTVTMTNVYKYITDTKFSNVINIILIKKYFLQVVFVSKSKSVFCMSLQHSSTLKLSS